MNEMTRVGSAAPVRTVEAVTLEINTLKHQAQQMILGYAIEIGRRLVEVKAMLPHGQWGEYLKTQVSYSQSTANNLMQIFEEYGAAQQSMFGPEANSQALGNLSYTKALRLLAVPADEREAFVAEHHVEDMSTRELEAAIKARDEALRQAEEDRAERAAAEQAREKISQDMKLANERVEQLSRELEDLRSRPVDVAVQHAEEEELEQARREAAEEAGARLAAMEAELESARKKQEDLARREKELAEAKKALERTKKELRAAGSKEIAQFGVYFDACQEDFSRMMGILHKLKAGGDAESRAKLTAAGGAMLEAMAKQLDAIKEGK